MNQFNPFSIAILVDGSYYTKRYKIIFPNHASHSPKDYAHNLFSIVMKHVEKNYLYRVFYYECNPIEDKSLLPISKSEIDFSSTPVAIFYKSYFKEIIRQRKFALRLGRLKYKKEWILRPRVVKALLKNEKEVKDLTDGDFYPNIVQKRVDTKIGLDIAHLAYKKLVNQIILISGDSDFVPAIQVARREGIDFILDPLGGHVHESLIEHIDGLKSVHQDI